MRNVHRERQARAVHDPLGLASHASEATARAHADAQDSSVNPLWMISAALAAFVVLLVVVW
ncbi:MAG: hypothetical protein GX535_14190 [Xanthomonadaceae bacterium]|nr:hypothetical protein [Xanthomonadaceae bacterium]